MKSHVQRYMSSFLPLGIFLLILTLSSCSSTTGTIEGTVVKGGQPMADIVVRLLPENSNVNDTNPEAASETKTGSDGKFVFEKVTPGNRLLTVNVSITSSAQKCLVFSGTQVKAGERTSVKFEFPENVSIRGGVDMLPDGSIIRCSS